jgi:hypothetical protein
MKDPHGEGVEALLAATQVGDTVRMRLPKSQINAEARTRVSPALWALVQCRRLGHNVYRCRRHFPAYILSH